MGRLSYLAEGRGCDHLSGPLQLQLSYGTLRWGLSWSLECDSSLTPQELGCLELMQEALWGRVVGDSATHPRLQISPSLPPHQALMSLFVLASKDGWVDIMYDGLDAVGVDQQVGLRWAGPICGLRSLSMG